MAPFPVILVEIYIPCFDVSLLYLRVSISLSLFSEEYYLFSHPSESLPYQKRNLLMAHDIKM